MKFQNPTIHRSKVNGRTHTQTDRQTDRQAKSNMPFQLFQSWGHNKRVDNGHASLFNCFFEVLRANKQYDV